jgi:hypothetical protein
MKNIILRNAAMKQAIIAIALLFTACSGELHSSTEEPSDAQSGDVSDTDTGVDAVHMTCFCTNGTHTISSDSQSECESNNHDDSPSPWNWLCTWSWQ